MVDESVDNTQHTEAGVSFYLDKTQINQTSEPYFQGLRRLTNIFRWLSLHNDEKKITSALRVETRALSDKLFIEYRALLDDEIGLQQFAESLGHCIKYIQRMKDKAKLAAFAKPLTLDLVNLAH